MLTVSLSLIYLKTISVKAQKIIFSNSPTYCNTQIDLWKWSTRPVQGLTYIFTLYTSTFLAYCHVQFTPTPFDSRDQMIINIFLL